MSQTAIPNKALKEFLDQLTPAEMHRLAEQSIGTLRQLIVNRIETDQQLRSILHGQRFEHDALAKLRAQLERASKATTGFDPAELNEICCLIDDRIDQLAEIPLEAMAEAFQEAMAEAFQEKHRRSTHDGPFPDLPGYNEHPAHYQPGEAGRTIV